MREIRRLESVEEEVAETVATSTSWSAGRRALFVLGIPIFLIGAGIAANAYSKTRRYKPVYVTKPSLETARAIVKLECMQLDLDSLSPAETVEKIWKPLTEDKQLLDYNEHPYIRFRRDLKVHQGVMKWAGLVAGLGLLMTVIPLLMPRKK